MRGDDFFMFWSTAASLWLLLPFWVEMADDRLRRYVALERGRLKAELSIEEARLEALSGEALALAADLRHEAADIFDGIARTHMGVTGEEFVRRWDRGDYEGVDWDGVPGLVEVAMALPFARRSAGGWKSCRRTD